MNKMVNLLALIVLLVGVAAAQKDNPAFAGTWNLDVDKSELGRRPIKSMTMTVTQSETELSYQRKAEIDEDAASGFGGNRRGMRGGGGERIMTFDLTGKETSAPGQGRRGGLSKLSASSKEGKLNR